MKSKIFVSLLVVVFTISMLLMGVGCKAEAAVEEVEEAAEEVTEEVEEAVEEVEEATEEEEIAEEETAVLGTEGLTYWIDQAGITPSGELTIYSYKDEGVTEWKIAQEYVETYPDITLNWVTIPAAEYVSKIAIEMETNTAQCDCFWSYAAWTTQFEQYLADVTDMIPSELKNDVLKGIVGATAMGDTWYGLPLFTGMVGLIYNKDILNQVGYDKAPETWDELFEAAEAATIDEDGDGIPEIYGLTTELIDPSSRNSFFGIALKSTGGSYWNYDRNDPQATFNNDKGVRALQILKKYFMGDYSDPVMATNDGAAARRSVASGQAAMGLIFFGSVEAIAAADFPENVGKFDYSLFPYDPGFDSWSNPGSMGFAIREGGNVDAALGFELFYMSPEMQKFMTQDYGFPTSRASLGNDEEYIAEYPYVTAAIEQANHGGERYVEQNAQLVADTAMPIFQRYLSGEIDEQTALDDLEEAFYAAWEE